MAETADSVLSAGRPYGPPSYPPGYGPGVAALGQAASQPRESTQLERL